MPLTPERENLPAAPAAVNCYPPLLLRHLAYETNSGEDRNRLQLTCSARCRRRL
jgi:hypothetical protein